MKFKIKCHSLFTFFTAVHVVSLEFVSREKGQQTILQCDGRANKPTVGGEQTLSVI